MAGRAVGKKRSSGCIPCKARKKKCDGRKPTCVGCERNILLCRWSGPQEIVAQNDISTSKAVSISVSTQKNSPRSSFPTRTAVLTKGPSLSSTVVRHPVSKLLYEHWFCQTAENISALHGNSNAFYTELPKLALRYPDMVLPSLLALSGVHYCNKYPADPAVKEMAWSHLAQALRALKYAVTKHVAGTDADMALPLLVTTLMLSVVETCRGDTEGNYKHHSRAARPLLVSVLASGLYDGQDSTIDFVMELYAYVTCITDLTVEDGPLGAVYPETESKFGPLISSRSPGMLLGCAYELFHVVPLISDFCVRQRNAKLSLGKTQVDSSDCYELGKEYSALRLKVSTWEPPADATSDFANAGRVYQEALLAFLEMSATDAPDSEVIKDRTDVAMILLSNIPQHAPIAVTLYWPLSLFASITHNTQYRETIRERFQQMYDDLGIGNILTIIDFLDLLWDDQTDTTLRNTLPVQSTSLQSLTRKHGTDISFL
ncbi:fungal-specific transcription factor domain-containing protein [Leptodontidium sp. 2 PMI_412]|nr:fungal-specific transcription factor domain-containing protein [Leptodontidium sp. 2 PMI_412]